MMNPDCSSVIHEVDLGFTLFQSFSTQLQIAA